MSYSSYQRYLATLTEQQLKDELKRLNRATQRAETPRAKSAWQRMYDMALQQSYNNEYAASK